MNLGLDTIIMYVLKWLFSKHFISHPHEIMKCNFYSIPVTLTASRDEQNLFLCNNISVFSGSVAVMSQMLHVTGTQLRKPNRRGRKFGI
jgi:hypothetical protein